MDVLEEIFAAVEDIRPELVGRKDRLVFLGLLGFVVFPVDVVLAVDGVTDVLDGFEVVTQHSALWVGLELPGT